MQQVDESFCVEFDFFCGHTVISIVEIIISQVDYDILEILVKCFYQGFCPV